MSGGQGGLWRDGLLAAGKVGRVRWLGEREERIPSCNRGLFPHALYLIFVFQFFFQMEEPQDVTVSTFQSSSLSHLLHFLLLIR
jgi:hypothetical protein